MANERDAFTIQPHTFRASHKRPYEALFLKEIIKASAVPTNPIGNQGKCNQCHLNTVYNNTGMSDRMIKIKI